MTKKVFVSCAVPGRQIGAIQFEVESDAEMQRRAEKACPERAFFQSFEVEEFDTGMPVGEFVGADEMKRLGY